MSDKIVVACVAVLLGLIYLKECEINNNVKETKSQVHDILTGLECKSMEDAGGTCE